MSPLICEPPASVTDPAVHPRRQCECFSVNLVLKIDFPLHCIDLCLLTGENGKVLGGAQLNSGPSKVPQSKETDLLVLGL